MKNLRTRLFGTIASRPAPDSLEAILRGIPIFEDLSRRELAAIERILHEREYQTDEIIFRQDEPGMGMYIIALGTVTIVSEPSSMQWSELGVGEFFGEIALLDEHPRSASAVAKTPCKIFGFFQPDLFALIDRNPRLGVKIVIRLARMIGARLRRANEQALSIVEELRKAKKGQE